MAHIILLGDSIFDNAVYTGGGPDVVSQVQELLPPGSRATLLAVDGSTTQDVCSQVEKIPSDATHLVLSVGGNDAIMNSDLLLKASASTLPVLANLSEAFEANYRRAVEACRSTGLPLGICTIYNGHFPDFEYQRLASTALAIFNDAILRVAFELRSTVIDLRLICRLPEDYANPIEPSSIGGAKIARCILELLRESNKEKAIVISRP